MKIKMITNMAGPEGSTSAGSIVEIDEKKAVELVSGGYAEYAEPMPIETAVIEPVETAVIPKKKRRKHARKSKLANNNRTGK